MSLVHAEYLKISRRKLFPILVVVLAAVMALTAVLIFVVVPAFPEVAGGDVPLPERPGAFLLGAQQVAGQAWWFAVILATAILGGEFGTTVWATSLTRDSRKVTHVSARFLVFTIAIWLAFLIGVAVWAGFTFFFAEGSGGPGTSEWLGLLWKFILIAAAWTAIGLGAVAMTRSIAVAMGVALGLGFLDSLVAPFVGFYENVSLTAATNGVFDVGGEGPFSIFVPGAGFTVTHSVVVMLGWSALGLALTWWGLQRRDA